MRKKNAAKSLVFIGRYALAGLAALASLAAAPASADEGPLLPKGWVRGAQHAEDAAKAPRREFGSFQANHEFTFAVRSSMPGGRVELSSLPVVIVEPTPVVESTPNALPSGAPGDVVVLKKGTTTRVSVQGFEAGQIRVGKSNPAATGRQSEGGLSNICGPASGASGIRRLEYEAIRRVDERGAIELVWASGFLDAATCRASIVARYAARPRHIGGGVVYAFLSRCDACASPSAPRPASARDVLHVLTPQSERRFEINVPFEHRRLELSPGKSAAFEGTSSFRGPGGGQAWSMPDWHGVVDRQCKEDSVWCLKSVRLEVSQGVGEPSPTVFLGGDVGIGM